MKFAEGKPVLQITPGSWYFTGQNNIHMNFRTSYWEQTTFLRAPDVAVIGAGLTGLQAGRCATKIVRSFREALMSVPGGTASVTDCLRDRRLHPSAICF